MSDFNWEEYDKEANAEDRVGKKTFVVTSVKKGVSGVGPWYYIHGVLADAHNAKCGLKLNAAPTAEDAERAKASGKKSYMRGVSLAHQNHSNLALYEKTADTLEAGDELKVETFMDVNEDTGAKFPMVRRILKPTEGGSNATTDKDIPF